MIINILDLDMTDTYDLVLSESEDGTLDARAACNHQVVSNLVRTRIQSEINWRLFIENTNIDDSIIAQQLRFVIDSTFGVVSSDFTDFGSVRNGRNINFSGICFTVDCANSQECFTI